MTFNEFYHRDYLARHANGVCKTLHVVGLPLAVVLGGVAVWLQIWWLLALLPVPVFLLAWLGHLCRHNSPTFFEYPWWSVLGYWKMIGAILTGKF